MNHYLTKQVRSRAFTLVEMIVSLAVFSVVAVVALGALTKIVSANRKAQTLQTSITNLNFALDSMSRELRVSPYIYCDDTGAIFTGTTLNASHGCSSSGGESVVVFKSTKTDSAGCNFIYAYMFVTTSAGYDIKKAQQTSCGSSLGTPSSIIDPNMTIIGYYLNVDWNSTTKKFPLATIRLSGYTGVKEREKTYFDIQTSVAPHVIN